MFTHRRRTRLALGMLLLTAPAAMQANVAQADAPEAFIHLGDRGPAPRPIPEGWQEVVPADHAERSAALRRAGDRLIPVYYEDSLSPVEPPALGGAAEPDRAQARAALGEYEPLVWALHTVEDHDRLTARLTPLADKQGRTIGLEHLDLRVLRYVAEPPHLSRAELQAGAQPAKRHTWRAGPLERLPHFAMQAGRVQHLWLTMHVPPSAAPGWYEGELTVHAGQRVVARSSISLQVLPVTLPAPRRHYGMYMVGSPWSGFNRQWVRPDDYGRLFKVWRAYGLSSVAFYPSYTGAGGFKLAYDGQALQADFTELGRLMAMVVEAGLDGPVVVDTLSSTRAFFEQAAREHGQAPQDLYRQFVLAMTRHAADHGWPPLLIAPGEEGTLGVKYARAIHGQPGVKVIAIVNSHWGPHNVTRSWAETYGAHVDVRQPNYYHPFITAQQRAAGGDHGAWYYNFGFTRLSFGFLQDMLGSQGYHQWAGEWPRSDPYHRFPGTQGTSWMASYPSPGGPLPTQALEVAREGIDDARYVQLLRDLSAKARLTSSADAHALADDAARMLDALFAQLPQDTQALQVDADAPFAVSGVPARQQATQHRQRIADLCVELAWTLKGLAHGQGKTSAVPSLMASPSVEPQGGQALSPATIRRSPGYQVPAWATPAPGNRQPAGLAGHGIVRKTDGARMVWVAATADTAGPAMRDGLFLMGDARGHSHERPVHPVRLRGFWMDEHEVTVGQWKRFLQATGYDWGRPAPGQTPAPRPVYADDGLAWDWALSFPDDHPIQRVSQVDALAYARWVGGTLPTEAQWEWAARGPQGHVWPWGDVWDDAHVGFIAGRPPGSLGPVTRYPQDRSWAGVVGLASGVREWCLDAYSVDEDFYARWPMDEPHADGLGARPLVRGGSSLYGTPARQRSAGRYYTEHATHRIEGNGFRVIMPSH